MKAHDVLADAVFDAESALRSAADTVDELGVVAASALRVLDEATSDAFYAYQDERRDLHLGYAKEQLARMASRARAMSELAEDLTRHLTGAHDAIDRAGDALTRGADREDQDVEIRILLTQIEVLSEIVSLARPVADQIARHAERVVESADGTDVLMLLDSRMHQAGRQVSAADGRASMMRSLLVSAQLRVRTSAELAGSLNYAANPPPPCPAHNQTDNPTDPGVAV